MIMKINYNQYLFAKLLAEVDKEWSELEYDLQFEEVPMRYEWFLNSKFNTEESSEYDCIVNYLHMREALKKKLSNYDFLHDFSNDHRRFTEGRLALAEIQGLASSFSKEDYKFLWNLYAPEIVKIKN